MFTILKEAIDMEYPHAERYPVELVRSKIMGPNPLKLAEEVLERHPVLRGSRVLDLGSGMALTSAFLYQQYGFTVTAGDLWSDPNENQAFLSSLGIMSDQVHAVHADAADLPFGSEEFDAITCIDAYNFFGREGSFLDMKLLPFLMGESCWQFLALRMTAMTTSRLSCSFPGHPNSSTTCMI